MMDKLALECAAEASHAGVIPAVGLAAHRAGNDVFGGQPLVAGRDLLHTATGLVQ